MTLKDRHPKNIKPWPLSATATRKLERDLDKMTERIYRGWVEEDMPLIKKMHPKALTIVPMYRSALVVEVPTAQQAKRGQVNLVVYHDPGWMGMKTTVKNLKVHSWRILLSGQRSGPDVYVYEQSNACHCSSFLRSIVGPLLERNG